MEKNQAELTRLKKALAVSRRQNRELRRASASKAPSQGRTASTRDTSTDQTANVRRTSSGNDAEDGVIDCKSDDVTSLESNGRSLHQLQVSHEQLSSRLEEEIKSLRDRLQARDHEIERVQEALSNLETEYSNAVSERKQLEEQLILEQDKSAEIQAQEARS